MEGGDDRARQSRISHEKFGRWLAIGFRIIASWIAAVSGLMIAFIFVTRWSVGSVVGARSAVRFGSRAERLGL